MERIKKSAVFIPNTFPQGAIFEGANDEMENNKESYTFI